MKKRFILFVVIMTAFPAGLMAEGKLSLSLEEAQEYAIEHNRSLKNASIDIQKAQAAKWQSIAAMLPQVSAKVDYSNYFGYQMDVGAFKISMPPYAQLGITSSVGLNGASIVAVSISDISSKMADINLEKTETDLRNQVAKLYYAALVTEETLRLLEQNLQSMRKLHEVSQKSVEIGVAEQTDADQLKVQVTSMESSITSTKSAIEMAYNAIRLQLCVDENTEVVLTQTLEELANLAEAKALISEQFDIQRNHDYQLLQQSTELARKQVALTGWSNGPTLSVFHQFTAKKYLSDATTMNMTPPNMLGVSLNIPIFTSLKSSMAYKDAKLAYKKQLNVLDDTELALNIQHRQLVIDLQNAIETYQIQEQTVEVAQRVFDNIALKYQHGVSSSLDVTNAGTNLISAQSGYIQAILSITNAMISLKQLMNK